MPNTTLICFGELARDGRHYAQLVFVTNFCSALMPRTILQQWSPTMILKRLFIATPAALFILANWPANAGQHHQRSGRSRLRDRQVGREGSGKGT